MLICVEQKGTSNLRGVALLDGFLNVSNPPMQKALGGMLKLFQTDRPKFTDGFVRGMHGNEADR